MSTERVLELRGVVAGHDGTAVVHGIDLDVHAGEVVALLGPNGAGKTTTLKTVSGLLPLLGGSIDVLGASVTSGSAHRIARRGLGHVTEGHSLFYELTVAENLRLARRGRGGRRGRAREATQRVLDVLPELVPQLDRQVGLLSGGQQQMVALARALVTSPRLLLVDEMSLGLAPVVVQRLLPVIRSAAQDWGAGVLLVEQHVGIALELADRAFVLSGGHITLSGPSDELREAGSALEASYLGGLPTS